MPNSKKKQRRDFQKVKLKVGKKLPKGDNVTDTSFKARKLIVQQKLKTSSVDQPTTQRKLNVNELLIRLQHYSISVRHESLVGLKELISTHEDVINRNLALLLEKVPFLCTDDDGVVRKAAISVLKMILQNVNSEKLNPLSRVLSAQLCCCMSHLNADIQYDSLFFFDVLMQFCPNVIRSSALSIFPNFINQISKQKDKNSTSSRSLSVNPSSKLSSYSWRKIFLERLNLFLKIILMEDKLINHPEIVTSIEYRKANQQDQMSFNHSVLQMHSKSLMQAQKCQEMNDHSSNAQFNEYIVSVLPLIFEILIEVFKSPNSSGFRNRISQEDSDILENSLDIVIRLTDFLSNRDETGIQIKANFWKDFENFFCNSFPYSCEPFQKMKKHKRNNSLGSIETSSKEVSSAYINLMISYFVMSHCSQSSVNLCRFTKYLVKALKSIDTMNEKEIISLLRVIKLMITYCIPECNDILLGLADFIGSSHPSSNNHRRVLVFVKEIINTNSGLKLEKFHVKLISCVAKSLVHRQPHHDSFKLCLQICSYLIKINHRSSMNVISQSLSAVIYNIDGKMESEIWRDICNLFYWCDYDEDLLKVVIEKRRHGFLPTEFLTLFIHLMVCRYKNSTLPVSVSVYFNFIFSSLISEDEFKSENKGAEESFSLIDFLSLDYVSSQYKHFDASLVTTSVDAFNVLSDHSVKVQIVSAYVSRLLSSYRKLSQNVSVNLLRFLLDLNLANSISEMIGKNPNPKTTQ